MPPNIGIHPSSFLPVAVALPIIAKLPTNMYKYTADNIFYCKKIHRGDQNLIKLTTAELLLGINYSALVSSLFLSHRTGRFSHDLTDGSGFRKKNNKQTSKDYQSTNFPANPRFPFFIFIILVSFYTAHLLLSSYTAGERQSLSGPGVGVQICFSLFPFFWPPACRYTGEVCACILSFLLSFSSFFSFLYIASTVRCE